MFLFFDCTVTNRRSSPVTETSVLKPIGLFSIYNPGLILIVSVSTAIEAAAPMVALASPSSNPLLLSDPLLETHMVLFVCTPDGLHDTPVPTDARR